MMRTGVCDLPLHHGRPPRWLFKRMVKLSRAIIETIVEFYGAQELLNRLSDPGWFQALGCILGFDWHSSGLTTTTGGALKLAIKPIARDLGIWICGGKGKTSRKTPEEITIHAQGTGIESQSLIYASRLSAKVDNTALQDGYQLYHHLFIFSKKRGWTVVQQGINYKANYARRYHWRSQMESYTSNPHTGIIGKKENNILNLVDRRIEKTRSDIVEISKEKPEKIFKAIPHLRFPPEHPIGDFSINKKYLRKIISRINEKTPSDFESLLLTQGLGPKSLRALALLANLIIGSSLSYKDPITCSFAHGGKDGIPFPVDRISYDQSINFLEKVIRKTKLSTLNKDRMYRSLNRMVQL